MIRVFGLKSGDRLQRKDTYFRYSNEEQFTGEYWINGKKIYCKVIEIAQGSTGLTYVATISDMDRLIKVYRTSFSSSSSGNKQVGYSGAFADSTGRIHTNFSEVYYSIVLIIYYTKTTD